MLSNTATLIIRFLTLTLLVVLVLFKLHVRLLPNASLQEHVQVLQHNVVVLVHHDVAAHQEEAYRAVIFLKGRWDVKPLEEVKDVHYELAVVFTCVPLDRLICSSFVLQKRIIFIKAIYQQQEKQFCFLPLLYRSFRNRI